MPKPIDHIDWAEKLEKEAARFDLATSFGTCQAITYLFYSALHYADAYLVSRSLTRMDHATRQRSMEHPFFDSIRSKYKRLKDMSREARYNLPLYYSSDFAKAKQFHEEIKTHILALFRQTG